MTITDAQLILDHPHNASAHTITLFQYIATRPSSD
jgi:hypothetical protein